MEAGLIGKLPEKFEGDCPSFERLRGFSVDIDLLRRHLYEHVIGKYPPVMQNDSFGGWSVQSGNGRYDDGWQQGHTCYVERNGKLVYDLEKARAIGLVPNMEYRYPTEICHGYLGKIMIKIQDWGFKPRRARISLVKGGGATSWHRDANNGEYGIRLHIPIVTNSQSYFATREHSYFLPADGSAYIVRVNTEHCAVNYSTEERYHLIMQVWDMHHRTQFNHFIKGVHNFGESPMV